MIIQEITPSVFWGRVTAPFGRAPGSQSGGHGFDPHMVHRRRAVRPDCSSSIYRTAPEPMRKNRFAIFPSVALRCLKITLHERATRGLRSPHGHPNFLHCDGPLFQCVRGSRSPSSLLRCLH